jgi:hypothetical protein
MLFDIDIWDWTREILFDTETSFDTFLTRRFEVKITTVI